MRLDIVARVERLSIRQLAVVAFCWVIGFAAIYSMVPAGTALLDADHHPVQEIGNTLYFSIVTAATLGDGQIVALGWLRALVGVEVIGGIVIAGLTVSAIVSIPTRQRRRAVRASHGWWV